MKRAIAIHRTDFVAILVLVALAVAVVGLHPRPPAGVHVRQELLHGQRRVPDGRRGHRRPGPVGRRSPACRSARSAASSSQDGRAVVTMNIYKKYQPIYRNATVLLRPRTPLKDMYLALDPGTQDAGAIPNGGMLGVANTQPDDQRRPDPLLARRRHAQLPAAAARRWRAGCSTTRRAQGASPSPAAVADLRGTFKRFAPLEPRHADAHDAARRRAGRTSGARSTTSASSRTRSAASTPARLADRLVEHELLRDLLAGREPAAGADAAARRRFRRRRRRSARSRRSQRRARRAARAAAVRARVRPGAGGRPAAVPRHDAGDPQSAAAVLDRGAAAREDPRAGERRSSRGDAGACPVVRCPERAVQHARLSAARRRAGLPVLGLVAEPHRRQPDRTPRTRTARSCAACSWRRAGALNLFEVALTQSDPALGPLLDLLNAPDWTQDPVELLPDGVRCHEQASPERGTDPDDGRVRGVVRRPAAVPVDLVRRLDSARAAGLPAERRVQRGGPARRLSPTCGSPA